MELAALVRPPAACSLCGLRVPGTARHVLGGRRQLRRQGLGGGAGGEEAAETLLRLSRDQEGAGRLVGTRLRAPRGSPSSLGLSPLRPAPPGFPLDPPAPPFQESVLLPACAGHFGSSPHPGWGMQEYARKEGECGEGNCLKIII